MLRRYRKATLVLLLALVSVLAYTGYAAQAHAAGGSNSDYGGYGSPASSTGSSEMGAEMTATRSALSSRVVVLKHRRTVRVNIQNLAFGPARIVVSPGTKVIWTNQDGFQHTTTSDKGLWDSGPVNSGTHFGRLFKKVGTFTYHCTIHPFMHGTITVSK